MEHTVEQGLEYAKKFMYQAYSEQCAKQFFDKYEPKIKCTENDIRGKGWFIELFNGAVGIDLHFYPEHIKPDMRIKRIGPYKLHRYVDYKNFYQ